MGIVFKQSFRNTLIIYVAFAFGALNALFLYTQFLQAAYFGLVTLLLSLANLIMPITAFGVQYTIVKFFSSYQDKQEKNAFLTLALFFPLFIAIPIGFFGGLFYEQINAVLAVENPIVKEYTYIVYIIAVATAYFEVFYAWSKVQMQSVYGNMLKELWNRVVVTLLLCAIFFGWISKPEFIYYLTGAYILRTLLMMRYAFQQYLPVFSFRLPSNTKELLQYSMYIILAGSAGAILLDIDKFMIQQENPIETVAYYAVAVYIGSVLEAPGRAMAQILQPITAKAINEKNWVELASLYKKSALNLFLICGLFFLLINLNITELYTLLPEKYSGGLWVVFLISTAKLYTLFLGNNGAIISNSKHYKILLPYGILMAVSVYFLNDWLIGLYGMEGAAFATLLVVAVFNTLKIWYVKKKMNLLPFTKNTWVLLGLLCVMYAVFSFVNFSFHPVLNIVLKSSIMVLVYVFLVVKLQISTEVTTLYKRWF